MKASLQPKVLTKAGAKPAARGRAAMRRRTRLTREAVAEIFRRFESANPDPKGELEHTSPFTLLVAVVLLRRRRR